MRYLVDELFTGDLHFVIIAGDSNETKPEGSFISGSMFLEVDTGKGYLFNENGTAGSKWTEV